MNQFREFVPVIVGLSTGNLFHYPIEIQNYYGMIGSKYAGKYSNQIGFSGPTDFFNGTHGTYEKGLILKLYIRQFALWLFLEQNFVFLG